MTVLFNGIVTGPGYLLSHPQSGPVSEIVKIYLYTLSRSE